MIDLDKNYRPSSYKNVVYFEKEVQQFLDMMSQLKEVNGELTAVIFTTRREKEALEREARFLGIYTNVKNKINNHDSTGGSFISIRNSFKKYIQNKKSPSK